MSLAFEVMNLRVFLPAGRCALCDTYKGAMFQVYDLKLCYPCFAREFRRAEKDIARHPYKALLPSAESIAHALSSPHDVPLLPRSAPPTAP